MPALSLRLWRLAFAACLAVVLALALMPIDQRLPSTGWDKSDHLLGFVVLTLLGVRAFPQRKSRVAIALLAYGIAIELLQALTPYRFAEWRDVVADAAGIGLAMLVIQVARGDRKERAAS
ncbi:VanZ family protein [Ramlibacter tataouinensis]|uniref:VanZ family protein n=1 Tax=Ramlibacter tataouinensis TaxID=94132 RepID=UPI0022F3DC3E|nr:VanZ family protein [Ramlibacter tataouinensis]WBY02088.1 VanZ family protein [Ramlibacter tataouinensis]